MRRPLQAFCSTPLWNWDMRKILLLFILATIFLPQIASISFIGLIEKKARNSIEIEKLKLSWFGPQVFQNVTACKASLEKVEIDIPFWSFLNLIQSKPEKLCIDKLSLNLGKAQYQEMQVWFTPIFLKVQNGIFYVDRMDALLNHSIHVCMWGKIDIVQDQLDIVLADSNYFLKIPVNGSIKDPEMAMGIAIAKTALLKATPLALRNLFSKKEKDVPPPKRPFPWE